MKVKFSKKVSSMLILSMMLFNVVQVFSISNDTPLWETIKNETANEVRESDIRLIANGATVSEANNFATMRRQLELISKTSRGINNQAEGVLYKDKDGRSVNNPTYISAIANKELKDLRSTENYTSCLVGMAGNTFNDVTSNDWYAKHIPLAVYYGLVNGYDDGSFKGDAYVTGGEVAKILSIALNGNPKGDINKLGFENGFGYEWYNPAYSDIAKVFTYTSSYDIPKTYMENGMKRSDIAYILAKILSNTTGELEKFNEKVASKDFGNVFNDINEKCVIQTDGTYANESAHDKMLPARFASAILYLQSKNVMQGDEYKNSNWSALVSRGELIALVERLADIGVTYTIDQYKSYDMQKNIAKVNTINGEVIDKILNPDAPAQYQIKLSDLNQSQLIDTKFKAELLNDDYSSICLGEKKAREICALLLSTITYNKNTKELKMSIPDLKCDYYYALIRMKITNHGKPIPMQGVQKGDFTYIVEEQADEIIAMISVNNANDGYIYVLTKDMLTGKVDEKIN